MNFSKALPSLVNGVSQQPSIVRLDSQCEEQVNCFNSVVHGMRKRPSMEHLAFVDPVPDTGEVFSHLIKTSDGETVIFTAYMDNGYVRCSAFKEDGTTVNVYVSTVAENYLRSAFLDNAKQLRAATVADYTFLVNPNYQTRPDIGKTNKKTPKGLFYCKRGDYLTIYTISIKVYDTTNGWYQYEALYTTPDNSNVSNASSIRPGWIIQQLYNTINTKTAIGSNSNGTGEAIPLSSLGTLAIENDVITFTSNREFSLTAGDSYNNDSMFAFKGVVDDIKDLPKKAAVGVQLKIKGDPSSGSDDYYVEYKPDADDPDGNPLWQEIAKPGIDLVPHPHSMPVAMLWADNELTIHPLDGGNVNGLQFKRWDHRAAGDDDTNPMPSFVGQKINDVFFYKNRLGFLSGENVVLSEAGGYFNFFANTVQTLTDSAPIDIAASYDSYTELTSTIPLGDRLLVFSEQAQFALTGDGVLTPTTATLDVTTTYETVPEAFPVSAGNTVFMGAQRSAWAMVREYYVDGETRLNDSDDITVHVPNYLEGRIKQITSVQQERFLAVKTEGFNGLYVYNYYWEGNQKVQSAWSKWITDGVILSTLSRESTLFVLVARNGFVYLEKMDLAKDSAEALMVSGTSIHLDRRAKLTQGNTALPFQMYLPDAVVIDTDGMPVTDVNAAVAAGKTVYVGYPFEMKYRFSEQHAKDQNGRPQSDARFQLRRILLNYEKTGAFTFTVSSPYRPPKIMEFVPRILGNVANLLNRIVVNTGLFKGYVMMNSEQADVSITSSAWTPVTIQTAELNGILTTKRQRI